MKKENLYETPLLSFILLNLEQNLLAESNVTWKDNLVIGDENNLGEY